MTRPCRFCGARVRIVWERGDANATAADAELIPVYDDHGTCPGAFEPMHPPAEPVPAAEPDRKPRKRARKRSRLTWKEHAYRLLLVHPRTSRQCSVAMACSVSTADRVLLELYRAGLVERDGAGRRYSPYVYRVRST